ncbi:TetR/AcrR family transcriptional regulator [Streptomyces albofaciens JCM 4342]|uniref:TetR/AcrR family transcriptional regulator n=1 Tax=Streptomyces albofaciens TaxID=66866 RepID=UPI001239B37F|nr:TetR/AcrR family transcriptional regulator [Streptomyces albofaciens]KAA6212167.1 TetR/AcrR family transcriptional regulator [Streptomyces albofaciens JCM 4342]
MSDHSTAGTERSTTTGRGPARRGRPARLSRDRIIEAALDIVTGEGSAALTMRRVAEALGSSPMSIYRHVRDKDELLVLLLDRIVTDLPRPTLPDEPRARLLALLTWQRDELAARPWIVDVLARGDLMAPSALWLLEEIYAAWQACGLSPEEAATANRIVWNFLLGGLAQHAARPEGRSPYQDSMPAEADADRYPTVAALRPYWLSPDRRDHFADDLARLVTALTATLPHRCAARPGAGG